MTLRRRVLVLLALGLLGVLAGWVYSGREPVTKSGKSVLVREEDITGEMQERFELRPGPLLGYYLGLDAVGGTAAASVLIYAATWWFTRKRADETMGEGAIGEK